MKSTLVNINATLLRHLIFTLKIVTILKLIQPLKQNQEANYTTKKLCFSSERLSMKKFVTKLLHNMLASSVTINLIEMRKHVTHLFSSKILNMKPQMYADHSGCKVQYSKESQRLCMYLVVSSSLQLKELEKTIGLHYSWTISGLGRLVKAISKL